METMSLCHSEGVKRPKESDKDLKSQIAARSHARAGSLAMSQDELRHSLMGKVGATGRSPDAGGHERPPSPAGEGRKKMKDKVAE